MADEQITLRPVRGTAPLRNEQGIWVFRTGQSLSGVGHRRTAPRDPGGARHYQSWKRRVKAFFDTSALVPVFYGDHVHHRASLDLFAWFEKSGGLLWSS